MLSVGLTVSNYGQDGQIHLSFPVGAFLQSDAVAGGCKDVSERSTNTENILTFKHISIRWGYRAYTYF